MHKAHDRRIYHELRAALAELPVATRIRILESLKRRRDMLAEKSAQL